eukprot:UN04683
MKKQLDFLVQYEVEFQGWQRRSSGKFTICYLRFLRKHRRGAYHFYLVRFMPWDPTNPRFWKKMEHFF